MERRHFVTSSLAAAASLAASARRGIGATPELGGASPGAGEEPFTLKYAPHFGMFEHHAGADLIDQLRFMHEVGFRALEDNPMWTRPVEVQTRIAREMERLDMEMGVISTGRRPGRPGSERPSIPSGKPADREAFLQDIRDVVEVAKRVNAKWLTVVPGRLELDLEVGYQTAHVIDTLRRASEILEPHGMVMVIEPLNWWANHPGMFLTKAPQAFEICRAVDSPACKILYDIYHQQVAEGNLIPNIDLSWSEIGYIQSGDNPGRNEPTTGEINYWNVFEHLYRKGYRGIIGMEHGKAKPGKEGERAVIEAYRKVDVGV
jgi:hydroxypyruvate isomerase